MSHQWVLYRNQRRFFQSLSKICRAAREALSVVLTSNCKCSELPETPSEEQRDRLPPESKRVYNATFVSPERTDPTLQSRILGFANRPAPSGYNFEAG